MDSQPPFSSYKALSFDVFGTLINWEAGFHPYLQPLLSHLPPTHPYYAPFPPFPSPGIPSILPPRHALFTAFSAQEASIMTSHGTRPYPQVLHDAYLEFASTISPPPPHSPSELSAQAKAAGASIHSWPAFPDSLDALTTLRSKHGYKLIALSNITNNAIREVLANALGGFEFDAVYTAEDIGSYKPSLRNFEYLLEGVEKRFGIGKEEVLHVAHGVGSDQEPAEWVGMRHVWVERGSDNWGERGEEKRAGMQRLRSVRDMAHFVELVERERA